MPRFSIVVPTRERAETLRYTLLTCITQTFADYEVVVCDNFSSRETKRVVDSIGSAKIRYHRSDRPLAMSDNWELAIAHAQGEYVIVIGDDDGLLPHALADLDHVARSLNAPVLRWERLYYSWPNVPIAKYANQLVIPINRRSFEVDGRKVIQAAGSNRTDYTILPMLYNAAIHRDLIAEMRHRAGRVLVAHAPDIASGYAFAALAGRYPSLGRPMTINGGSAKSSGIATILLDGTSVVAKEFGALLAESPTRWHPGVPAVETIPTNLADGFLHVKDVLFPHDRRMQVDRRKLTVDCLQATRHRFSEARERDRVLDAIRASLRDDPGLLTWLEDTIVGGELVTPVPQEMPDWRPCLTEETLVLDASAFGAENVYDVALLYDKITGHSRERFEWKVARLGMGARLRRAARALLRGE